MTVSLMTLTNYTEAALISGSTYIYPSQEKRTRAGTKWGIASRLGIRYPAEQKHDVEPSQYSTGPELIEHLFGARNRGLVIDAKPAGFFKLTSMWVRY